MIHKNLLFQVGNGVPPFKYQFLPTSDCAYFMPTLGTSTDGLIATTVYFQDENCLDNFTGSLVVQDDNGNGCSETLELEIDNFCNDLSLSNIIVSNPLSLNVIAIGGTPPYTYTWVYDTNLYEIDTSTNPNVNGSVLPLKIRSGMTPYTTVAAVFVEDANGCTATMTTPIADCVPSMRNTTRMGVCLGEGLSTDTYFNVNELIIPCPKIGIDWTTLSLATPPGITWTRSISGSPNIRIYTTDANLTGGNYIIPVSVYTGNNQFQLNGIITYFHPICADEDNEEYLRAIDNVVWFDSADVSISAVKKYNLDSNTSKFIMYDKDIDWNTFTFIASPGQSVSADGKTLTDSNAYVRLTSNKEIEYEFRTTNKVVVPAL